MQLLPRQELRETTEAASVASVDATALLCHTVSAYVGVPYFVRDERTLLGCEARSVRKSCLFPIANLVAVGRQTA